jgi:hypothetical protein
MFLGVSQHSIHETKASCIKVVAVSKMHRDHLYNIIKTITIFIYSAPSKA